MQTQTAFMLDTNVFNDLVDGKIDPAVFRGRKLVATHIQRDEIQMTRDESRKNLLLDMFDFGAEPATASDVVPTESSIWDLSRWDLSKWGRPDGVFADMLRDLNALNGNKRNNVHDVLIAETALRNDWTLITADKHLTRVATQYGCNCVNVRQPRGDGLRE